MTISYPINAAPELVFRHARFRSVNRQGMTESPFTGSQQVYDWAGKWLELDVAIPPLIATANAERNAENLVAWGLSLNGIEGTLLMGPPGYSGVFGSFTGTPLVKGAQSARAKSLLIDGIEGSVNAGAWFQLGSGASTHLHKLTQAGVVGSPSELLLEIWPPLREDVADNATVTVTSPKGLWRLSEDVSWDIELALIYGIAFSIREFIE